MNKITAQKKKISATMARLHAAADAEQSARLAALAKAAKEAEQKSLQHPSTKSTHKLAAAVAEEAALKLAMQVPKEALDAVQGATRVVGARAAKVAKEAVKK